MATGDTAGKVDAELEREDQYIFLPLLLRMCMSLRMAAASKKRCGGVCSLAAQWGRTDEGHTRGGS